MTAQHQVGVIGSFPALNAGLHRCSLTGCMRSMNLMRSFLLFIPMWWSRLLRLIRLCADGLITVAAGAGRHTGSQPPVRVVQEMRHWFDVPLRLCGTIAHRRSILTALAAGYEPDALGTTAPAAMSFGSSRTSEAISTQHLVQRLTEQYDQAVQELTKKVIPTSAANAH